MSKKRLNAVATNLDIPTDSIASSTPSEQIVEDYQKLNEKMDRIISKIKGRKEKKLQQE